MRALALAYPLATSFAVLATGNHFLLDIVGGLATFALALALVAAGERAGVAARLRARFAHARALPALGPIARAPAALASRSSARRGAGARQAEGARRARPGVDPRAAPEARGLR